MAKGGHGLPKFSPGSTMPYCSTPCGQGNPETALWPFQGWPARRAIGLRPSSTHLDTLHRIPYTYVKDADFSYGYILSYKKFVSHPDVNG
jgi:hypothetical protein